VFQNNSRTLPPSCPCSGSCPVGVEIASVATESGGAQAIGINPGATAGEDVFEFSAWRHHARHELHEACAIGAHIEPTCTAGNVARAGDGDLDLDTLVVVKQRAARIAIATADMGAVLPLIKSCRSKVEMSGSPQVRNVG
jgi:hypothetical protein